MEELLCGYCSRPVMLTSSCVSARKLLKFQLKQEQQCCFRFLQNVSLAPVVSWPLFPLSLSLAGPSICKPLEWREEGAGALFHPPRPHPTVPQGFVGFVILCLT